MEACERRSQQLLWCRGVQSTNRGPQSSDRIRSKARRRRQAELQRRALERRPDLRSAVLKAERASADTKLALSERWEDWTIGAGVERSRSVIEGAPPQSSSNQLALSLSIPLPLADSKQGRIEE